MKAVPLFASVSERSVEQLAQTALILDYKTGQPVFRAAQKARDFYIVIAGQVRIYKISPKGDEQTLHIYGPGDTFGEAVMLAGVNYPAFAQMTQEGTLLVISRAALVGEITRDPELALRMMAGLAGKLREFASLIEQLSLKEVPARLAAVLLNEARRHDTNAFRLDRTKREMAAQIGTVPETLSRTLAKMKAQGIIKVDGSRFTILDMDALEAMAQE